MLKDLLSTFYRIKCVNDFNIKNVFIDKLDDIVNKYNKTYHRTIKMKAVDVKWSTYIDFNKENNKLGTKFKVDDHVRISKYKIIFAKAISLIGLKKFLWLNKLTTLCHGHILLVILMLNELLEHSMKKNCKKQIKKSLELKK